MTLEEQYKQETEKDAFYWFENDLIRTDNFIAWLKNKIEPGDQYKLRCEAAAVAIEALVSTAEDLGIDLSGVSEYEIYLSIVKQMEKGK